MNDLIQTSPHVSHFPIFLLANLERMFSLKDRPILLPFREAIGGGGAAADAAVDAPEVVIGAVNRCVDDGAPLAAKLADDNSKALKTLYLAALRPKAAEPMTPPPPPPPLPPLTTSPGLAASIGGR